MYVIYEESIDCHLKFLMMMNQWHSEGGMKIEKDLIDRCYSIKLNAAEANVFQKTYEINDRLETGL